MPILVSSTEDIASMTIKKVLLDEMGFKETNKTFDDFPVYENKGILLLTTNTPLINTNHLEEKFPTDLYIYLSRHTSYSKNPGLLTHTTGNWIKEALFGGQPESIAIAPSLAIKKAYLSLKKRSLEFNLTGYPVTMEATHHGPTIMNTPLIFIEIGSSEEQWKNETAAQIVALSALDVINNKLPENVITCLGIGGPHYCPNFNKLIESRDYATGHIIPKYVLENMNLDMIKNALTRTIPKCTRVVLDRKGIPSVSRQLIDNYLKNNSIETERVRSINHG